MGFFDFLKPKKISLDTAINNVRTELLELKDETMSELYDYNYWFDIVINRAETYMSLRNNSFEIEDLINLIEGHFEEYHYRMIENKDDEKVDFILPRILAFRKVYFKLAQIDKKIIVSQDLFKLDMITYHAFSSLYGGLKFTYYDITGGQSILERVFPNYDIRFMKRDLKVVDEDSRLHSISLFPTDFRSLLSGLIKNKIQESFSQKNTSEYVNLIKLIDNILSTENQYTKVNHNEETLHILSEFAKYLNMEQKTSLKRFFIGVVLYSKKYSQIELIIYLVELSNIIKIDIIDSIKNELDELEQIISIKKSLEKININTFQYVESIKSRFLTGEIKDETELKKVIETEFSLDKYVPESEITEDIMEVFQNTNDNSLKIAFSAIFVKIPLDFLGKILNENEDDKFYGFDYIENYYFFYGSIYTCLDEKSI